MKKTFVLLNCLFSSLSWGLPQKLKVPQSLLSQLKSFEPSAALFLPDLDQFLVASDDTTDQNDPWLFFVKKNGEVDPAPAVIKGLGAMTDIESLSQDETGALYLLASQSLNKKGHEKIERNLFVKARRNGTQILAENVIALRPLLLRALSQSNDPQLTPLKNSAYRGLDIESHFLVKGELMIGLKNPQISTGEAWILSLGSIDQLFRRSSFEKITLKMKIRFSQISKKPDLLSELLPIGNTIFMTTTTEAGGGRLWSYEVTSGKLRLLRDYGTLRPEGLGTSFQGRRELFVFFDQGQDVPQFDRNSIED